MGTDGGRIGALDAVRGSAILAVIATHVLSATVASTDSYAMPPAVFRGLIAGQFGVQLFFALSGWLIFSLYRSSSTYSPRVYWSRRWARIWPLWAVFVVVGFVMGLAAQSPWPIWVSVVASLLFFGWLSPVLVSLPPGGLTIQQEMGHYLLFALLRRRGAAVLAGTVIAGYLTEILAHAVVASTAPDSVGNWLAASWLRLALFTSWPFFLLGGAGYLVWHRWREQGVNGVLPDSIVARVMVLVALLLGLLTTYANDTPGYYVLGFVLLMAAIAVVANGLPVVGPMFRSIGRYSYFIYFFHFLVLKWLEQLYRSTSLPSGESVTERWNLMLTVVLFVVTTAISWLVGLVSWHLLEKRVLAIVHRTVPSRSATS